jgi:hypothetical protein
MERTAGQLLLHPKQFLTPAKRSFRPQHMQCLAKFLDGVLEIDLGVDCGCRAAGPT